LRDIQIVAADDDGDAAFCYYYSLLCVIAIPFAIAIASVSFA